MVRSSNPAVRTFLIERAARMLRRREPITLRSLVAGTDVSTMAIYTHFGGMEGLWRALRQEGFTRLAASLSAVALSTDSVADLTALVAAYVRNALQHPDLYRVMFDATFDLDDFQASEDTLQHFVQAARRGVRDGRFHPEIVPFDLATQTWILGHGLVSLVAGGPLSPTTLAFGAPMLTALYAAAGDDLDRCQASVQRPWSSLLPQLTVSCSTSRRERTCNVGDLAPQPDA
jgi:AcrR family transcriptional regulator